MTVKYVCKIASADEVEKAWNYQIKKQKQRKAVLESVKKEKVEQVKNHQAVTYYGKLRGKIICETTALFDENIVQNSAGLVDDKTVYLCNFYTAKKYQGKGYFSKLFRFMLDDLKSRGYVRFTLGVEPCETRNLEIYRHLGFNEYIKSGKETYTDGTVIDVDYYLKETNRNE